MFTIRVGGLLFESAPSTPGEGFIVEPEGFTGWYDGVGVRASSVARPHAHGTYDLPVFKDGRSITIKGTALARSEFDLAHMGSQVAGLLAEWDAIESLTVQDPLGSFRANVRLSAEPKFTPRSSGLEADFQVTFFAADPRKYSAFQEFRGQSVNVFHRGNFGASPVVRVNGPTAGYNIFGPDDKRVTVTQALTSQQYHVVDFRTGRLFRGPELQSGGMSRVETWTVPPGGRTSMEITGADEMVVTVRDTSI